jgi:hypothetical protein
VLGAYAPGNTSYRIVQLLCSIPIRTTERLASLMDGLVCGRMYTKEILIAIVFLHNPSNPDFSEISCFVVDYIRPTSDGSTEAGCWYMVSGIPSELNGVILSICTQGMWQHTRQM